MAELTITAANFEQEVLQSDKPVLVDFWAAWCNPCKMMSPVVSQFAQEHPEIKVGKVNVDEEQELANRFSILSIPTIMVFKGGEVTAKSMGFQPMPALLKMVEA